MKTMAKMIIGIMQAVLIGFLICGVCMAGDQYLDDEAIPISPYGVIDTAIPTYEWTSVPGATMYCLLVENIDGVPLYLAWYTDEEAGCKDDEEYCSVTTEYFVDEGVWSVLPCSADLCGHWSELAPVELAWRDDTYARTGAWEDCEAKCHQQKVACDSGCASVGTKWIMQHCPRGCTLALYKCMQQCGPMPTDACKNKISTRLNQCPKVCRGGTGWPGSPITRCSPESACILAVCKRQDTRACRGEFMTCKHRGFQ